MGAVAISVEALSMVSDKMSTLIGASDEADKSGTVSGVVPASCFSHPQMSRVPVIVTNNIIDLFVFIINSPFYIVIRQIRSSFSHPPQSLIS